MYAFECSACAAFEHVHILVCVYVYVNIYIYMYVCILKPGKAGAKVLYMLHIYIYTFISCGFAAAASSPASTPACKRSAADPCSSASAGFVANSSVA